MLTDGRKLGRTWMNIKLNWQLLWRSIHLTETLMTLTIGLMKRYAIDRNFSILMLVFSKCPNVVSSAEV